MGGLFNSLVQIIQQVLFWIIDTIVDLFNGIFFLIMGLIQQVKWFLFDIYLDMVLYLNSWIVKYDILITITDAVVYIFPVPEVFAIASFTFFFTSIVVAVRWGLSFIPLLNTG